MAHERTAIVTPVDVRLDRGLRCRAESSFDERERGRVVEAVAHGGILVHPRREEKGEHPVVALILVALPLSDRFVRDVARGRGPDLPPVEPAAALEGLLASALSAGRATWPSVCLDEVAFLEHLANRLREESNVHDLLSSMRAADVYLACALAHGDAAAVASFEAEFLAEVGAFVAQIDRSPSFADEVRQQLREKLLVRQDGPPKIVEFSGRGPLGGFVRVAAVRTALNLKRGKAAETGSDESEIVSVSPDPEIDYLKTRYGAELKDALETTLLSLSPDERNVLRMHYIDGLNIDEIGATYHVHRSTVARWLAAAREKILEETKRLLSKNLRIDKEEVESMIFLVQSRLEVSIHRFLAKP
jgi:RNA polymerase sigma-70 factor (ECF subfamily)